MDDIVYDIVNCSPSYTRFTTSAMTEILPELKDAPSEWNTNTHYFYEIYTLSSHKVLIQMAINSKNITDDFRATCDAIQKHYPSKSNSKNWGYRWPFKTKPFVSEAIEKGNCFPILTGVWMKSGLLRKI